MTGREADDPADDRSVERPLRIAVVGASEPSARLEEAAEALGEALGRRGATVLTGGLGGVMAAASRGAARGGGLVVGILPGEDPDSANPWVALPLPTGLGEMRNALLVRFADAVVAVGGRWGTLAEVALAARRGTPVATISPPFGLELPLPALSSPEAAAEWAVGQARERGGPDGASEGKGRRSPPGIG